LVEVLASHGFSGWETFPVAVERHGDPVGEYSGLRVVGRCGPMVDGPVVRRPPFTAGGPSVCVKLGITFDPASWDGSDIFMPADETLFIFTTERVERALGAAKLRNLKFTPLPMVELDARPCPDQ
jgi:hypothetical protein